VVLRKVVSYIASKKKLIQSDSEKEPEKDNIFQLKIHEQASNNRSNRKDHDLCGIC
jgi:hypothetical protein